MANPAIITDYAGLKNAIEDHLNRTDTDDEGVSALCVDLAEARFNRELRTVDMIAQNTVYTVDAQYTSVPSGLLEVRRFVLNRTPVVPLEPLTLEEISQKRVDLRTPGVPLYYAVIGNQFEFLPSPADSFTADLIYYQQLTPLSGTVETNWLLAAHPDIYLFACLAEAENYFHHDMRALMWEARLQRALKKLQIQDERARVGMTPIQRTRVLGGLARRYVR